MERFRNFAIGVFALFTLSSAAFAANYLMTQGAGTTFGSILNGGVNYPQMMNCDPTTPAQCAAVSAAGRMSVDGSGVTQPVSGTVNAAQSGTWTVQPGNTANTTPWLATINQGGNSAAVKAASTGAVAADPSVVTNESPNSQLSVATGTNADAAWSGSGNGTTISILKKLDADLQAPIAGVTQAQTSAAASSLVAKASAGSLVSVSGSAVSGSFIMVFNATSAPADGAVTPVKCWGPMAAAGPFVFGWGPGPVLTMSTGITIVSSSTGCFTKTATNAAFISAEYQ